MDLKPPFILVLIQQPYPMCKKWICKMDLMSLACVSKILHIPKYKRGIRLFHYLKINKAYSQQSLYLSHFETAFPTKNPSLRQGKNSVIALVLSRQWVPSAASSYTSPFSPVRQTLHPPKVQPATLPGRHRQIDLRCCPT